MKIYQIAYKCQSCNKHTWSMLIPASVDGVFETLTGDDIPKNRCIHCDSEKMMVVFSTTNVEEAMAYTSAIVALEEK